MSLTPRRNLGLKAVSLVLAYATWAFVVGRSPGVRFINAPLEFATPDNLVVTDYSPREVRVRLQGESPLLDRLSEQNVYARVQLEPTMRTGRAQKIGVQEREILGVPNGISKEIITPSLTVAVERRVTKNVAVRVRTSGSPPQGFRVVQAATEPQTVEISGPEGAVHAVEQVWTEAIDTKNHKRAFTGTIDLVRPDPLVTLKPDNVRVNVFVDEVSRPIEILAPVRSSEPSSCRTRPTCGWCSRGRRPWSSARGPRSRPSRTPPGCRRGAARCRSRSRSPASPRTRRPGSGSS